ncbi:MAG: hypothetical protein AAGL99_06350 [Pseudomonadota bacterium]
MTHKTQTHFSDWIIMLLAGPQIGEAIAGDLSERGETRGEHAKALIRSIPGLIRLAYSNITPSRMSLELAVCMLAITLAWAWEVWVAQVYAWPIASQLVHVSPLSVAVTCKLAYLGLFTLGAGLLLSRWSLLNTVTRSAWRVRVQRFGVWGLAGLIPVLFLLVNPGPYDGDPFFRYVQIALIVALGLGTSLYCRANLRPA